MPNLPEGLNEESLEDNRKVLVEEVKKKQPNGSLIAKSMEQTFPLRRQEIVRNEPAVQDMVECCTFYGETGKLPLLNVS